MLSSEDSDVFMLKPVDLKFGFFDLLDMFVVTVTKLSATFGDTTPLELFPSDES